MRSCGLKYDPHQLYEDSTGVLAHYDDNGDGVLSRLEFCSLACALCPSRHEDLTDRQIHALIRHRWGCREGVQSRQSRGSVSEPDLKDIPTQSSTRRRSRVIKQQLDERDKLLRHCFYLQVVEKLKLNSCFVFLHCLFLVFNLHIRSMRLSYLCIHVSY